jgi:hypothetical protein
MMAFRHLAYPPGDGEAPVAHSVLSNRRTRAREGSKGVPLCRDSERMFRR